MLSYYEPAEFNNIIIKKKVKKKKKITRNSCAPKVPLLPLEGQPRPLRSWEEQADGR